MHYILSRTNITTVLVLILVLLTIFLSGCSTCNSPYIEYKKGDCCLDVNENNICDLDENIEEKPKMDTAEAPDKEACPFDCCIRDEYKTKLCNEGHECKQNRCVELDSDGDGLTDIKEKQLGTNPFSSDTDSDGLSDDVEVNLKKTSPTNPNTDGDRYIDGEDVQPLNVNSADIVVTVEKIEAQNADLLEVAQSATTKVTTSSATGAGIGSIIPGLGTIAVGGIGATIGAVQALGDVKAYFDAKDVRPLKFVADNSGDDYSEFTEFDLYVNYKYEKSGTVFAQKNIFIKSYSVHEKISSHTTLEKGDVFSKNELRDYIDTQLAKPEECQGILSFCKTVSEYNVQNIEFERFD
jgi:hypothetical protein